MDLVCSEIPKCMCCGCWGLGASLFHFSGPLAVLSSLSWHGCRERCLELGAVYVGGKEWLQLSLLFLCWGISNQWDVKCRKREEISLHAVHWTAFYCLTSSLLIAALWHPGKTSLLNPPDLILFGGNKLLPILQLHQLCKVFLFAQVQFFLQTCWEIITSLLFSPLFNPPWTFCCCPASFVSTSDSPH